MVKEVLLATRNQGKIREFATLLSPVFERLTSLRELYSVPDIVEDEKTFKENALKKARIISGLTKKIKLADDSGLEVEALGGRPGVFSARYAGEREVVERKVKEL